MSGFKYALIALAIIGSSSGLAHAELRLAQKGMFTADDAYSQMGGMPFELSTSLTGSQAASRVADQS